VNFERNEITLRAEMTKTRTGRVLPIRGGSQLFSKSLTRNSTTCSALDQQRD
jgi:hypothetical protein